MRGDVTTHCDSGAILADSFSENDVGCTDEIDAAHSNHTYSY